MCTSGRKARRSRMFMVIESDAPLWALKAIHLFPDFDGGMALISDPEFVVLPILCAS